MTVTVKNRDGKKVKVECRDWDCPKRECFGPGFFQHRSCNNQHDSGCDDYLSCMYRNYHGCPDTAFDKTVPIGKELETLLKRESQRPNPEGLGLRVKETASPS